MRKREQDCFIQYQNERFFDLTQPIWFILVNLISQHAITHTSNDESLYICDTIKNYNTRITITRNSIQICQAAEVRMWKPRDTATITFNTLILNVTCTFLLFLTSILIVSILFFHNTCISWPESDELWFRSISAN